MTPTALPTRALDDEAPLATTATSTAGPCAYPAAPCDLSLPSYGLCGPCWCRHYGPLVRVADEGLDGETFLALPDPGAPGGYLFPEAEAQRYADLMLGAWGGAGGLRIEREDGAWVTTVGPGESYAAHPTFIDGLAYFPLLGEWARAE